MAQQIISQSDIDFLRDLLIEAGDLAVDLQAGLSNENNISANNNISTLTVDEIISSLLMSRLASRFANHTFISEEGLPEKSLLNNEYVWLIDPIDGTHHYLANDSQYSIMIGLLWAGKPIYGWVYNPAFSTLYHGGPGLGAWRVDRTGKSQSINCLLSLGDEPVRVILGRRDKKNNLWLDSLSNVVILEAGSIGYKLSKILENEADVLLHLAGCLKVWDTAGPVALALGAGLEVGSREIDYLHYPQDSFLHPLAIVMGKSGSLEWFRSKIVPAWIP